MINHKKWRKNVDNKFSYIVVLRHGQSVGRSVFISHNRSPLYTRKSKQDISYTD